MKNGRLFELLYLLVERRALTAGELAERFEVSERTIYRDVDALSAAGVPVYTQRGQGGGIRLMDQFVLDRCLLSPREQDEVLFALRALLSTGGLEGAEALERLSALFRREAEGWVEVDFTDWGSGEQERENFRIVREGILGRRLLDFTYYASSGTDIYKGLLLVASAVNFENFGPARDEILAQLEAMRRGEITPEELESSRLGCSALLRVVEDDPLALEGYWLPANVSGSELSPAELAASCELVTAEELAEIARSCELDAEFYLCGREGGEDAAQAD